MPNIVTNNIRIANAKNFLEKLSGENNTHLYVLLGKPTSWENDNSPPDPIDSPKNTADIWDNALGLKRILANEVKHVVKRVNWSLNEIYDFYDDKDTNLLSKRFYVMNKDYDVFKCIFNNNGSPSTVEPTGKNPNIFTTQDGYRWKYLYTVNSADQLKFLTRNWMPVQRDDSVAIFARDGGIEQILLNSGGTDYSAFANIVIDGDGSGALITPKNRIGVINGFNYINSGSGYRFANAYVADTTGRFANIRAIISPVGGHGNDPIVELGAKYLMMSARTEYNEGFGDIPPDVQFRQVCIVRNPLDENGDRPNALTLSAMYKINLANVNGSFIKNEYLFGANSRANAYCVTANLDILTATATLAYIQSDGLTSNFADFVANETVIGRISGATGKVTDLIVPEAAHDTGEIMYIENRTQITRSLDQAEFLHLVIEF